MYLYLLLLFIEIKEKKILAFAHSRSVCTAKEKKKINSILHNTCFGLYCMSFNENMTRLQFNTHFEEYKYNNT